MNIINTKVYLNYYFAHYRAVLTVTEYQDENNFYYITYLQYESFKNGIRSQNGRFTFSKKYCQEFSFNENERMEVIKNNRYGHLAGEIFEEFPNSSRKINNNFVEQNNNELLRLHLTKPEFIENILKFENLDYGLKTFLYSIRPFQIN